MNLRRPGGRQPIDRTALHEHLWRQADRFGKIRIFQTALAEELGCTKATMSAVIRDLRAEGRIKRVGTEKGNVGLYVVRDPGSFEHPFIGLDLAGIGVLRCAKCGELEEVGKHP